MSTLTSSRVLSDIFTLGGAEIGWQNAEAKARDLGMKGGLGDVQAKADAALAMKDQPTGTIPKDLATAPDITDDLVRRRRAAMATQLMLGQGRKSTFATGELGNLNLGTMSLTGGTK